MFAEHLRVLMQTEAVRRPTGSMGYARAASYVADRMAEYGLQPALGDEYRTLYYTPLNRPVGLRLLAAGTRDTLRMVPGRDALLDGRSDSGRVVIDRLAGPLAEVAEPIPARVLPAAEASAERLRELARSGTRVVFVAGELAPTTATHPVRGLLVVRVTRSALAQLAGIPASVVASLADGDAVRQLPRPIHVHVVGDFQPVTGAINLLGFVPGKHPVLKNELVIVGADLDALGGTAATEVIDGVHMGEGTAALLELAELYGIYSRYWTFPERTILFVVWSGAREGHVGFQAFLQHVPWANEKIRHVVYIGLEEEVEAVEAALGRRGLPLTVVTSTRPLPGPVVVRPALELRPERRTADDAPARASLLRAASERAEELARETNAVLLPLVIDAGRLPPSAADTLRVPLLRENPE